MTLETLFSDYYLIEKLGSGHFSKVYLARERSSDKMCAIKVIRPKRVKTSGLNLVDNEIQIHSSLPSHPYVAQFYGSIVDKNCMCVIMEYCGSDLFTTILKPNLRLNSRQTSVLFRMICEAVSHCHENGIIHGDIKPENFGFYQGKVKLFDFGLSQRADHVTRRGGTRQYMAPELIPELVSDVWSAGVILYELIYHCFPNPKKITYPDGGNTLAIDLLKKILVPNPSQRIKIRDVLEHPYLKIKPDEKYKI